MKFRQLRADRAKTRAVRICKIMDSNIAYIKYKKTRMYDYKAIAKTYVGTSLIFGLKPKS